MTPLMLALNSALLHLLWQGVVVAFLLWIVLAALRGSSANARYVASCGAMGILALAPIVTAFLVYDQRPIEVVRAGAALATVVFMSPIAAPSSWLALPQTWILPVWILPVWILPVWTCGVALLSIRLLFGYTKVSALRRTGDPAEPAVLAMVARLSERVGVSRTVRVLISSLADGPSVIGALRPVILLPAATLLGLSPEQLEAVLAHELAHIGRYDYLVNIIQMVIETLFFYHPAVWWISGRIRQERELCCDDIAVRSCGDAVGYARALTALERLRVMPHAASLALGAGDAPLMYRIQRLLGATPREHGPSRLPGMVAILLAVGCLTTGMNPAKAEKPLLQPPAPPSAPALSSPPPRPQARKVTQLAQVFQPAQITGQPASSPSASEAVTVEVTIDKNGEVSDARVITGPAEQRRSALLRALSMRFPTEDASTSRWVDIPAIAPVPFTLRGLMLHAVPTRAGAKMTILDLTDRIKDLTAQQADASKDPAQLQGIIDRETRSIQAMQQIAAGPDPLVGTTLDDIQISNLTDAARDQLLAQLPIHVHDVLTDDSMRAAVRVVHEALPNATIYFGQTDAGQAGFVVVAPAPYPRPLYLVAPLR